MDKQPNKLMLWAQLDPDRQDGQEAEVSTEQRPPPRQLRRGG